MNEGQHPRLEGYSLIEVIVALTVLSVGLLATAGLVRAVSREADHGRAESGVALLAQQELEAALADAAAPVSLEDTLHFAGRDYAVEIAHAPAGPELERISIVVVPVGPPGFGNGAPRARTYSTRRRSTLPGLAPPANGIP